MQIITYGAAKHTAAARARNERPADVADESPASPVKN